MTKRISIFLLSLVLMLGMPVYGASKGSHSKKSSSSKTHKTKKSKTTSTTSNSAGIECKDGTISHAKTRRGACSHHGGIR